MCVNLLLPAVQAAEAKEQLEAELQAAQQRQRASGGADLAAQQLSPRVPSPQEERCDIATAANLKCYRFAGGTQTTCISDCFCLHNAPGHSFCLGRHRLCECKVPTVTAHTTCC